MKLGTLLLLLVLCCVHFGDGFSVLNLWPFSSGNQEESSSESESSKGAKNQVLTLEGEAAFHLDPKALNHFPGLTLVEDLQSSTDKCLLKAFVELKVSCIQDSSKDYDQREKQAEEVDERKGKLAIAWLNCQRERSRWPPFPCSEGMSLQKCTAQMTPDDYTQFNLFYLKVNDVCLALNNEISRMKIEQAIKNLHFTTINSVGKTKETIERIMSLHDDFVSSVERSAAAHQEINQKLGHLGTEAEGHFQDLITEVNKAQEAQREQEKRIRQTFEAVINEFKAGSELVQVTTKTSVDSLLSSHQELGARLTQILESHLETGGEVLKAAQNIKQTQEAILNSQKEQLSHQKVIGETTQRMGNFLKTLLLASEIILSSINSLSFILPLFGAYCFFLQLILIILPPSSPFRFLSAALFLTTFLWGLLPSSSSSIIIHLLPSAYTCMIIAHKIWQVLCSHASATRAGGKGGNGDGGMVVVAPLVDYIVQLRATQGRAPIPHSLYQLLVEPPPSYSIAKDEDGEETLFCDQK